MDGAQVSTMRNIPDALRKSKRLQMTRGSVMQALGELLHLRGYLNMHWQLMETPVRFINLLCIR